MRMLPHMTQLAMRWQWDDDATDTTRHVARTLEAICSENMLCFSMNVSSAKEDIFLIWCLRTGQKEEVTRTRCWVHPCFNKGKHSSFVTAENCHQDRDKFKSFYRMTQKSFKFCPFFNNQYLSSRTKQNDPRNAGQVEYLLRLVRIN